MTLSLKQCLPVVVASGLLSPLAQISLADNGNALEEIIVTANKRESALMKTATSI